MSHPKATDWTDQRLLQLLHLRDVEGLTFAQIAERFGVSRSSVVGAYHRIDKVMRDVPADRHDGSMPPRWWAERRRIGHV
ncbi:GcrA family cell cycle regulator [Aestuariibius insulae]|uniref:GcrA family cell cycle regulator n=1 Tax=Aestuariibius insulae TaxID=2058287 RepID=UPI00345F024C